MNESFKPSTQSKIPLENSPIPVEPKRRLNGDSVFSSPKTVSLIAFLIALIALIYYVYTGRGSLDVNSNKLEYSNNVEKVNVQDAEDGGKSAKIKCKDGSEYEIYYPPGTKDYDSLSNNNC